MLATIMRRTGFRAGWAVGSTTAGGGAAIARIFLESQAFVFVDGAERLLPEQPNVVSHIESEDQSGVRQCRATRMYRAPNLPRVSASHTTHDQLPEFRFVRGDDASDVLPMHMYTRGTCNPRLTPVCGKFLAAGRSASLFSSRHGRLPFASVTSHRECGRGCDRARADNRDPVDVGSRRLSDAPSFSVLM